MCERVKLTPITLEEKAFAEEHHSVLVWYLNTQKLDKSEYYDVAAMGYLAGRSNNGSPGLSCINGPFQQSPGSQCAAAYIMSGRNRIGCRL